MQAISGASPLALRADRFARLKAIEWWDQSLLDRARVMVIGAGALGNEVLKNLALLGVGHVVVADMDRVELSNLSRSVLFRESDEGHPKADCAAQAAQRIYPAQRVQAIVGNVLADVGLGLFRWADAVLGALDNREARVFVNSACARVGRPWFDGGIEVLNGVVRGFAPPRTACYECTMSQTDWDLLNERRSCSLLARRALAQSGTPTTPTTASIIGAMQVQEMIKHWHGRSALLGRGFIFEGTEHSSYTVQYPLHPDCPWHETPAPVLPLAQFNSDMPLQKIWEFAAGQLGELDAIDLSRELVERLDCAACGHSENIWQPADKIDEQRALCPHCKVERAPVFIHSINGGSPALQKTAGEAGLPLWDIVWPRRGTEMLGVELSGDRTRVLSFAEDEPPKT
jgi:adenylyltransferase/sulfurtransferase